MEVVPLLECGSCVVQLSVCGDSLLISTLARSLLLDVDSGRVTQVNDYNIVLMYICIHTIQAEVQYSEIPKTTLCNTACTGRRICNLYSSTIDECKALWVRGTYLVVQLGYLHVQNDEIS